MSKVKYLDSKYAYLIMCGLLSLTSVSLAAKIYKWVDDNGKTHYSSTPPTHQESISMGNTSKNSPSNESHTRPDDGSCNTASKSEMLVGVWQLKKQPSLHFRFYDRWHLTGSNNESLQKYSFDVASGKLQTGTWSVKNNILKLKVETINEKQTYFKPIKKARLHKINKFELYLLINDTKAMKFERDSNAEFQPKCMDKNHHDETTKQDSSKNKKTSVNQPINKSGDIGH